MRQSARLRPSYTSRPPRHRPAQAHAARRTRAGARAPRLSCGLPHQKCSADFSANPLICLKRMVDFAQVGLAELERLAVGFGVSTGSGLSRIKGLGWAKG